MNISNNLPIISVIVPVYNSEKFLHRCLNSIKNQTMKNIEVIMVNDGSTDSSIYIMNEFNKKYDNFKLIDLNNVGAAYARNKAIEVARGKYLSFVDSDDFIRPNFLETLYNAMIKGNADIACCEYSLYIEKSRTIIKNLFGIRSGVYSSQKMINLLIKDFRIHAYLWNKLFKKELFLDNNIRLYDMCYEDMAACTPLFYYAKSIAVVNKSLYFYTIREGSLVRKINRTKFNDYIRVLAILRTFLEQKSVYDKYKLSFILYSLRTMIVNVKLLFFIHIDEKNFKGFISNLNKSNKRILYCISRNFAPINNPCDFLDTIDDNNKKGGT